MGRVGVALVMIGLGFWLVRLGESDNAPALGGLGVFLALFGLWLLLRPLLRRR